MKGSAGVRTPPDLGNLAAHSLHLELLPILVRLVPDRHEKAVHLDRWLDWRLNSQLRAANIISEVWGDLKGGLFLKRKFEREFSEFEVFLEAIPTTFIATYIRARFNNPHNTRVKLALRGSTYSNTTGFVRDHLTSINHHQF